MSIQSVATSQTPRTGVTATSLQSGPELRASQRHTDVPSSSPSTSKIGNSTIGISRSTSRSMHRPLLVQPSLHSGTGAMPSGSKFSQSPPTTSSPAADWPITSGSSSTDAVAGGTEKLPLVTAMASYDSVCVPAPTKLATNATRSAIVCREKDVHRPPHHNQQDGRSHSGHVSGGCPPLAPPSRLGSRGSRPAGAQSSTTTLLRSSGVYISMVTLTTEPSGTACTGSPLGPRATESYRCSTFRT
mmetsp:Transcript_28410/g.57307  ORF Transcript_28410/g.57307 Transcript_28410/m.57307 type:complete len:244 (+) Transcript_28410:863-1594(+)